jgi:UDP-2,3-diacylglucosamine pyrophosphatase LpxH
MAVALVADAHLGGPGGPGEPLIEQLEALPKLGCSRLIFLGDLFHVWVGDRRFETPPIRSVLAAVQRIRRQGVEVVYIEGNRDFFLDRSCYSQSFDRIVHELALEQDGTRYLAVHGDGLNDRDWRYRFWRWLSKSAPSRLLARRIPLRIARRIVSSTERRLSQTNFKHKNEIPEAAITRYGRRRLAEGYQVLLLGHFHERRTFHLPEGEVRLLDAWCENPEILWLGAKPEPSDSPGERP